MCRGRRFSTGAGAPAVWDRAFRCFRLRRRPEEISPGPDYLDDADWRTLPAALAIPFRSARRPGGTGPTEV